MLHSFLCASLHIYFHSAVPVPDLVLGIEVAAVPEGGAEAILVQGPDPVLSPAPGPSLPEETEREPAVDRIPGMALSRGALTHAASLQLGSATKVPIPAASPEAHLLTMAVLAPLLLTKKGVLQLRRCAPAVPPLPREVATKTNNVVLYPLFFIPLCYTKTVVYNVCQ